MNNINKIVKIITRTSAIIFIGAVIYCIANLIDGVVVFNIINTQQSSFLGELEKQISNITNDNNEFIEEDPVLDNNINEESSQIEKPQSEESHIHNTIGLEGMTNGLLLDTGCPSCGGLVYLVYCDSESYVVCENKDLFIPYLTFEQNPEGFQILQQCVDKCEDVGNVFVEGVTIPHCPICGSESCEIALPILFNVDGQSTIIVPTCGCFTIN